MSKEIPFFSSRQINAVGEYERFYHTKAYLQSLSPLPLGSFKLTGKDRETFNAMMEASGYAHYSKFLMHKKEWDRLERRIPLQYLRFLGVERNTLDFVLDLDYREYEEAVEYLYDVVKEKGFQCCINYPALKTIFIDSRQGVNTVY
jgi:hypothetical protein